MKNCLYRFAFYSVVAAVVMTALIVPGFPSVHPAHAQQPPINALYLLTMPSDYQAFENLIKSYKDNGADTLIIRPVANRGSVDKQALAKAVFFAHSAGMKLFAILPTRSMTFLLEEHPDWEDMHYDLKSGTFQPAGKLDLFNPFVIVYLSDLFRDIAGYSLDGILLDEDFHYKDTEGMSKPAIERYKQKYGTSFSPRSALRQVKEDEQNHRLEEYGEAFWSLAELKKNALLLAVQNIMQSSHAVNKEVKFGVTLHVPGMFVKEREVLAWYSLDMNAFKKINVDFFWLGIPHREIRAQQDLNYKKSIEVVSRSVTSAMYLVNDPHRTIIGIQTISTAGKILPLFEIEEVSTQAKKTGDPGIALMVAPDTQLPPELTQKIFKRQPE